MKLIMGVMIGTCFLCLPLLAQEQALSEDSTRGYDAGYKDGQAAAGSKCQAPWCLIGTSGACAAGCAGYLTGLSVTCLFYPSAFGCMSAESPGMLVPAVATGTIAGAVLGGFAATSFAQRSVTAPRHVPPGDSVYQIGYVEGYVRAMRKKRSVRAMLGALIGVGIDIVVLKSLLDD